MLELHYLNATVDRQLTILAIHGGKITKKTAPPGMYSFT